MNPSGLFKILLALAPVLAVIFYLISMKQEQANDKLEKFSAQHDQAFSKMAGEMELDTGDKGYWEDRERKAQARLFEFENRDMQNRQKTDREIAEMEKELSGLEVAK